jgi:hypothetical protein
MDENNIDLTKNSEIQKALKEFEEKDTVQIKQDLPSVKSEDSSAMVKWVIKHSKGAIKEERQAEYVLISFFLISIIFFLFTILKSGPKTEPPPESLIEQAGAPSDF